jgi:hypothetical protein
MPINNAPKKIPGWLIGLLVIVILAGIGTGAYFWWQSTQTTTPQVLAPSPVVSSGGQPSGGQPSGGQPSGGQPSGGQPSGGQPSGGQPSGGQPSGGQPVVPVIAPGTPPPVPPADPNPLGSTTSPSGCVDCSQSPVVMQCIFDALGQSKTICQN